MKKYHVDFGEVAGSIDDGMTILDALRAARIEIPVDCGGRGTCGKCRVQAAGELEAPAEAEKKLLSGEDLKKGIRLACRARVRGAARVGFMGATVSSEIAPFRMEYVPNPGVPADTFDAPGAAFGVAIDIGTTTLNARLADLKTGEVLASVIAMNPQRLYGADVASRINSIIENKGSLEVLHSIIVSRVQDMLDALTMGRGASAADIRGLVVVGNPTMTHMFLGIDPRFIAPAPFVPPTSRALDVDAAVVGLKASEGARLLVLPAVAAYVGADAVAAALRVGLHESGGPRLLIDLGTNAEMLLSVGGAIFSCAAAAGPAIEGARISCGAAARDGAIDRVSFDSEPFFSTIGGLPPDGLCGTGILDSVAGLLDYGVISPEGRIEAPSAENISSSLRKRIRELGSAREFVMAALGECGAARDVVITQRDVREIQLARGAIRAGLEVLIEEAGVAAEKLEAVYLAGALGTYLRPETALRVGLVPDIDPSRIKFVGNAALDGATEALLSACRRERAYTIGESVKYIELSSAPMFSESFTSFIRFPEK
jgi:uncharacterized 2Fe-2S/4Fe-4S cluster protein (DUF4445 family)